MLPVDFVEAGAPEHMELSVGLIVVFQVATNPGLVLLTSLLKCMNMFPEVAVTAPGRDVPENVPSKMPEELVPS